MSFFNVEEFLLLKLDVWFFGRVVVRFKVRILEFCVFVGWIEE